ncbi:MAG: 3-deoxy-D-manno-octulosonic acid transferase [Nitrospirae bacterium]|nr:3-deoxy-D-manno-octulosonic acid transferase [Nitrospirota bacterium]
MFFIYSALLYLLAPIFFPIMAINLALRGKSRAGLRQRLGIFDDGFFGQRGSKTVWVHAVSVGETLAAVPLVSKLKYRNPGVQVYFSTVTETGNAVAREKLDPADRVFYFPFDFPFAVNSVINKMRPDVFVVVETELWPNLLHALSRQGIPAVMVNGRISPRSYRNYYRARFFMRRVLALISRFSMQTAQDAVRIKAIGAPHERVIVAGNVKFDQACASIRDKGAGPVTRASLGLPESALVMVAGSTHGGEEEEVIAAYRKILVSNPDACLILAPRHPERLEAVRSLLAGASMPYRLKSGLGAAPSRMPGVILLDTMGELSGMYRVGDINFVGGSWVSVGGHNILEPAAFGKAVFHGPHMHNFAEIRDILMAAGVAKEVRDGVELAREGMRLVHEPERVRSITESAREALTANRGALERNVGLIEGFL